jgi:hypothetical protein
MPRPRQHRFENAREFFSIRPIRLKLKRTKLDGRHAQITFGGYQFALSPSCSERVEAESLWAAGAVHATIAQS